MTEHLDCSMLLTTTTVKPLAWRLTSFASGAFYQRAQADNFLRGKSRAIRSENVRNQCCHSNLGCRMETTLNIYSLANRSEMRMLKHLTESFATNGCRNITG